MRFPISRYPFSIAAILSFAAVPPLMAQPPAWWSQGSPPLITGGAQENRGMANTGQAKYMASRALAALQAVDPQAASAVNTLLLAEQGSTFWDLPDTPAKSLALRAPLQIGQLKAIADPFYRVLHASNPTWLEGELQFYGTKDTATPANYFPWTAATTDDQNKAAATIGQLKAVFSLRFDAFVPPDTDGDGLPDAWEVTHFGGIGVRHGNDILKADGLSNKEKYQLGLDPNVNYAAAAAPVTSGYTYDPVGRLTDVTSAIAPAAYGLDEEGNIEDAQ